MGVRPKGPKLGLQPMHLQSFLSFAFATALACACCAAAGSLVGAHGTGASLPGRPRNLKTDRLISAAPTSARKLLQVSSSSIYCEFWMWTGKEFGGDMYSYLSYEWQTSSPPICDADHVALRDGDSKFINSVNSVWLKCTCTVLASGNCWPVASGAVLTLFTNTTDNSNSGSDGTDDSPAVNVTLTSMGCADDGISCSRKLTDLVGLPLNKNSEKRVDISKRITGFRLCLGPPAAATTPLVGSGQTTTGGDDSALPPPAASPPPAFSPPPPASPPPSSSPPPTANPPPSSSPPPASVGASASIPPSPKAKSPPPPPPRPPPPRPPPPRPPPPRPPPSPPPPRPPPPNPPSPRPPPPKPPSPPADVSGGSCTDPLSTLATINAYRVQHAADPATWSIALAKTAQAQATALANAVCSLALSASAKAGLVGESAYTWYNGQASKPSCSSAVQGWYTGGASLYKYTDIPFTSNQPALSDFNLRGFTQMVWKASKSVGCGIGAGYDSQDSPCYVVVCQYSPAGLTKSDQSWLDNVKAKRSGKKRFMARRGLRHVVHHHPLEEGLDDTWDT